MSTPTSTPRIPNHKPTYSSALTPSASAAASSPAAPSLNAAHVRSVPSPANMRSAPSPANLRSVPSPAYLSSLSSKPTRSPQATRSPQMTRSPHANSTPRTTNAKSPYQAHALHQTSTAATPKLGVSSPAAAMLGMGPFITGTGMTPLATGMTPLATGADVPRETGGIGHGVLRVHDPDDERRRRLDEMITMVGAKWGRVSAEGVERCARRVGLECLWEEGGGQRRTLSIAGHNILIDVEFTGEEIGAVLLSFPTSGEGVGQAAADGAEVLRRDLQGPEGRYVMLDAFVDNLERLAVMDRFGEGSVNCFDAVQGVHESLRRIFAWEVKNHTRGDEKMRQHDREREVMCGGSGRPRMHTRGRVGLALQYWAERRLVLGPLRKGDDDDDDDQMMDVDNHSSGGDHLPEAAEEEGEGEGEEEEEEDEDEEEEEPVVYSAIIECEACSSSLYPSIRTSTSWVSAAVEKHVPPNPSIFTTSSPSPAHLPPIDWQDPAPSPATTTTTNPTSDPMQINATPLLSNDNNKPPPNVRFIARLHPPIVLPLQAAIDLYESVGAPLTQDTLEASSYESLLFPEQMPSASPITTTTTTTTNTVPPLTVTKPLTSYDQTGIPHHHNHKYTLFTPPQSFARTITTIPFSHPRQIVALLPLLRQYALLGSILRRTFALDHPPFSSSSDHLLQVTAQEEDARLESAIRDASTLDEELAALLATDNHTLPPPAPAPLTVDIELTLPPAPAHPRLNVLFASGARLRSGVCVVGLNGVLEGGNGGGSGSGGVEDGSGDGEKVQQQQGESKNHQKNEDDDRDEDVGNDYGGEIKSWPKALAIAENIGVAVAWAQQMVHS